jgi:RNA polymerase sigma factor (sigma-70 family)
MGAMAMVSDPEMDADTEDKSLSERIRGGDPGAENALIRRYSGRVFAMVLARLRDREAARELVDDVLMVTVLALREGGVRDTSHLAAFVHGTTVNLVNNHLRARGRRPHMEALDGAEDGPDFDMSDDREDELEIIERAVTRLPPADREVLNLSLLECLKPGEIAARLGLTPDVVRQRKRRAVRHLREALDKP